MENYFLKINNSIYSELLSVIEGINENKFCSSCGGDYLEATCRYCNNKKIEMEIFLNKLYKILKKYEDLLVHLNFPIPLNKTFNLLFRVKEIDEVNNLLKKYNYDEKFRKGIELLSPKIVDEKYELTISPLPSTTLNKVVIKLTDDLTLIDTPGLIDRGSIINYVDFDTIKKINAKKEIDPYTFQIKEGQCVVVDNLFRIDYLEGDKNSFTFFMSNDLGKDKKDSERCELLKDLSKRTIEVGYHQDLVINGLGFIKITDKALVDVYVERNTEVFVRDSLI